MSLTENGNGMYMPVAPAYGGGNGGFGWGGDWAWILLLLLIGGNGWGMGGFGGWGGAMMGMDYGLYPWLNNSQHISDGFRDQTLQTSITGLQNSVTAGFGDVQNSLCSGFAGVNASIANASMNNMQQLFGVQSALQNCCCENRAGLADLKYTVATENCADRTAAYQNTRDIIDSQTRGTQAILDKLCALELDGVKGQLAAEQRESANLRTELMYARGQASQTAQTAELRQSGATQLNQLVSELRSCPIPSQPVYGTQPIFTCGGNTGCGCGGNF